MKLYNMQGWIYLWARWARAQGPQPAGAPKFFGRKMGPFLINTVYKKEKYIIK
jgi:hypothetical protein